MHTLQTELSKYINLQANTMQSGVFRILQLSIKLYEVSLILNVQLQDSVYKLVLGDVDGLRKKIDIPAASYTPNKVLEQIRIYAKAQNKLQFETWSDEYFVLVDAFADVGIAVMESVGFKVKKNYFHALLSKDEVQCFFVISPIMETDFSTYHLASYPNEETIPDFTDTFINGDLNIDSVVHTVLSAFEYIKNKNSQSSASTTHRSSVPNPPEQGSVSPNSSTIRLYDAIVELLIAVHRDKRSLNDEEVLDLLKTARERFKP